MHYGPIEAMRRRCRRFLGVDEEGGTNTIEFVLWLPIFILVICLVVDVCFLFLAQAIMFDVASDTARRAALGLFSTQALCEEFAREGATFLSVQPTATCSVSGNPVSVVIQHDPSAIDLTGVFALVGGSTMQASVTQLREGL